LKFIFLPCASAGRTFLLAKYFLDKHAKRYRKSLAGFDNSGCSSS
jgi:hypothetical protein